jgi:hypothetical protein
MLIEAAYASDLLALKAAIGRFLMHDHCAEADCEASPRFIDREGRELRCGAHRGATDLEFRPLTPSEAKP